jgi:glycosyltransferase involved in cell wall biosynthesis
MMEKPLRVALFSGNYNYTVDGPALTLNRLVKFLEHQGIEVLVFSPTVKNPPFKHSGTLISAPSVPFPTRREYRMALGLPRAARARLKAFRPTLFHLSAPDFLGYAALRLARRWHIPAVASFHTRFDSYVPYYGGLWLKKAIMMHLHHFYRQCAQVYVPSESMLEVLRKEDMARDLRIWSRGVDCSLFNPDKRDLAWRRSLGIGDDEVVISFVGRLVMEKGLDSFARALGHLSERGINHRVLVVGDGPEHAWLEERLPAAVFTGFLSGQALARAYASSDIFFNPSVTETFGNVTLEAMAAGVPALCADATGSCSLVTPKVTGFLVPPENETGYVDALAKLVCDASLRKAMGEAGRRRSRDYDWDTVMQGLLANYRDALYLPEAAPALPPAPAPTPLAATTKAAQSEIPLPPIAAISTGSLPDRPGQHL